MIKVLYEDQHMIVVVKPAGVESQAAKKFAPDMISEIRKHMVIHKTCTPGKEPYVAVIHRLDKPVSGVMVYAKTKTAAAALSEQVQNRKMDKYYEAVICGKPVDNVDKFVDYLKKSVDGNYSQVVDKEEKDGKRAELTFETLKTAETEDGELSLVRIHLLTGRHHQIRVQFSHHGLPLFGDGRYNPKFGGRKDGLPVESMGGRMSRDEKQEGNRPVEARRSRQTPLALCAVSLAFDHPVTGKRMEFSIKPTGGAFAKF